MEAKGCVECSGLIIFLSVILSDCLQTELKFEGGRQRPWFKIAAPEFISHQVIVPSLYKGSKELSSTAHNTQHVDDISIRFAAFHKNFTLDLKINRNLFSPSYIEKSFTKDKENIVSPQKHRENHCNYHGKLRSHQYSVVAVSTCNGISGYIWDGHEGYHIEPAFDIDGVSHRIYREKDSRNKQLNCGAHPKGYYTRLNETKQILHTNQVLSRMKRSLHSPYNANINTRYVELYLVNDYRTFDSNGRHLATQVQLSQSIVNIVSALYQQLNIYVVLVGIETWTDSDRFKIEADAKSTLENFLHYRKTRINPRHHNDNSQLITHTKFNNGVVGKAMKGTICTYQYSGGVNLNLATPGQTAATVAHELGHNFGMDHDNYTMCKCRDDKCIMAATSGGFSSGGFNTPTLWSSCSMATLQEAFEMGMDYCLKNKPEQSAPSPVCGNGFTEDGEECDCGLLEECTNHCCNVTTCMLSDGANCATGSCCNLDTCKPKPAATLCRPAVGECDLPEFCFGTEEYCPPDVYMQNGQECRQGQSYCYLGNCRTHTDQCKLLWGTTGRVSDPICFRSLNGKGTQYGSCGYNWTTNTYKPCLRDDVMCGLLHCVHQNEKLMFWKESLAEATPATFLTVGHNTYICRSAILDVGLDMPDPGMVMDGAKCEDRKICVKNQCTPLSHLNFASCPHGCSDRGVCNSKGNCHCDEGFGHPVCDIAGNGGSINSGPVKIQDTNATLVALLVVFLVVLPLIGVAIFAAFYFRISLMTWITSKLTTMMSRQPTTRPEPPSRPPPRQFSDAPIQDTPRYPKQNGQTSVIISEPVLTRSTHPAPHPHAQRTPPPRPRAPIPHKEPPVPPKPKSPKPSTEDKPDTRSRFSQMFKLSNVGKTDEKPASPKPAASGRAKPQSPSGDNGIKRREISREISNPILISTTDRRSKHMFKLDNVALTEPPPPPSYKSLYQDEEDDASTVQRRRPERPMSMPESELDEVEFEVDTKEARKSLVVTSNKFRPPPPLPSKPDKPVKSADEDIENSSTAQSVQTRPLPLSEPKKKGSKPLSNQVKTARQIKAASNTKPNIKPGSTAAAADKPSVHVTPTIKPRPDNTSRPAPVPRSRTSKTPTADTTEQKPKANKSQWSTVDKPIFNPKSRPGVHQSNTKAGTASPAAKKNSVSKPSTSSNKGPAAVNRKASSDSIEDDPTAGSASVSGLAKRFEDHKKPLLGGSKDVTAGGRGAQQSGSRAVPKAPPKPKQVRSVDV